MNIYPLFRRLLFMFDPETAHAISMTLLGIVYRLKLSRVLFGQRKHAPVKVFGLEFPNAVGLAAGLDKNGDHIDALAACGFGFIEIGTVTPRPQPGNPKPRLFRLVKDQAIINRMGFNNAGVEY
ncbi:MAG: quinone-dependent dihydroorotate dehydrogenase, partial [Gammaproteobacteria bacterium]|nr:quinone-dependent dihydroorotate dehydrogenase [Gammaproteobacteria bacterium]